MAKKKPMTKAQLKKLIDEITRTNAPGVIQEALAVVYAKFSRLSTTEAENDFWFKCARASQNLASGMNKWAGDMIDELEEGEESDTEGG